MTPPNFTKLFLGSTHELDRWANYIAMKTNPAYIRTKPCLHQSLLVGKNSSSSFGSNNGHNLYNEQGLCIGLQLSMHKPSRP